MEKSFDEQSSDRKDPDDSKRGPSHYSGQRKAHSLQVHSRQYYCHNEWSNADMRDSESQTENYSSGQTTCFLPVDQYAPAKHPV